jgi:hypothetical protein
MAVAIGTIGAAAVGLLTGGEGLDAYHGFGLLVIGYA